MAETKQDYGTPEALLEAVERRFGPLVHDLAAHVSNRKCATWYGPGSPLGIEDALSVSWAEAFPTGALWLNPPFAQIEPWARKCAEESARRHGWIVMLTPASVASAWYVRHVFRRALTIPLVGRLVFDGTPPNARTGKPDPYPKDLMLSAFGFGAAGFEPWDWRGRA